MDQNYFQNQDMRPVQPVRPVAPYIGGKRALAERLTQRIDAIPHTAYAEPFTGMGGVFLRRKRAPKVEVINDISGDVTTFFRILQRHYVPFMDLLRFQFTSRTEFDRLLASVPETLTDLERAVRFLYLQRLAFGGKVRGRNFGVSADRPARFDVSKLAPLLVDLNERLTGIIIERLPYAEFIRRYDHAGALFYLDPPYYGCEDDYGLNVFSRADFEHLAQLLGSIKGRFILSLNDCAEVRKLFGHFLLEGVELTYTITAGKPTKAGELIISSPG